MGQSANPKSKLRAQINKVANFCAAQWQDFAPALTHGFLPEREVMTGIGKVPVQVPRVRDRGTNEDGSKIKFRSSVARQSVLRPGFETPV